VVAGIVLVDFGCAFRSSGIAREQRRQLLDAAAGAHPLATRLDRAGGSKAVLHKVIGTTPYMAPEFFVKSEAVARADLQLCRQTSRPLRAKARLSPRSRDAKKAWHGSPNRQTLASAAAVAAATTTTTTTTTTTATTTTSLAEGYPLHTAASVPGSVAAVPDASQRPPSSRGMVRGEAIPEGLPPPPARTKSQPRPAAGSPEAVAGTPACDDSGLVPWAELAGSPWCESGESKRLVVESPWSQFTSECQRF
jgi:hypothetical protein